MTMAAINTSRCSIPTRPARASAIRTCALPSKPSGVASLAVVASIIAAAPVRAAEEPVDTAVESVVDAIKAAGEVVKSGVSAVQAGVDVLKEGYDIAAPVVERAYNAASPVVGKALKATVDAAAPAIEAALPSIKGGLESTGFDVGAVNEATSAVSQTAASAVTSATPLVTRVVQVLSNTDPVTLGEYALGAAAFVYFAPALLGGLGGSFRGFAGELAPAAALNSLADENDVVLVDIRTLKEKETSGVPDLPSTASNKVLEVEYANTEDKRLRGQLRDPNSIEAQITALQVSALKRINKGTKVVLLDRYGPAARTVAKELGRKGYTKVFVVAGGFDGRGGWVQSKLQIKPAASVMNAAPPSFSKTVFTRSSRALPAPKST
ncbi:hypothetical protein V8C86DRAFT_2920968 [Haematococcus lacustris]